MFSWLKDYVRRGLGKSMPEGYVDIEVNLEDDVVEVLVEDGLAVWAFPQVLILTDKGNAWLKEYCERVLEKHNAKL